MYIKPVQNLKPNTPEYETTPLIKQTGFREYDARWLFKTEINLAGITTLGMGLGILIRRKRKNKTKKAQIIVGHDYREYSQQVKNALIIGLINAGCHVHDIGLCLSPTAYFAQWKLNIPAVAMVTASHNENGWTGIKMGYDKPLTLSNEDMADLKKIVMQENLAQQTQNIRAGKYIQNYNVIQDYKHDLIKKATCRHKLRVVAACGNGTASLFAPDILRKIGCTVIDLDTTPDYTFPKHNPNPEDISMLNALSQTVKAENADIGFAFDGDGDRCGVVDGNGEIIFADKIGVLIARHIIQHYGHKTFVVDVKSTALFQTDHVLKEHNADIHYWKTGHSYMKHYTEKINAVAGFEKSGHYFFRKPIGRGYDDGILAAIIICNMLAQKEKNTLHKLKNTLTQTWSSPTIARQCPDQHKYQIVKDITQTYQTLKQEKQPIAGETINHIQTINGVRFTLKSGAWGLIRASSNKPEIVIVCESMTSKKHLKEIFKHIDIHLSKYDKMGAYNQKI